MHQLAGSKQLRATLPLNEHDFKVSALSAQTDVKSYLLYSVLDEVFAAGITLVRWNGLLDDAEELKAVPEDPADRIMAEMFAREKALWNRRLVETLAHLICFGDTNEEKYYRHFMLRCELRDRLFQIRDYMHFYGGRSQNLTFGANRIADEIRSIEGDLDLPLCWYLSDGIPLPAGEPNPNRLLAGFNAVLKRAVKLATPRERMELGVSYEGFSAASGLIHVAPGHHRVSDANSVIRGAITVIALLTQSILVRAMDLIGEVPEGLCSQLKRVYDSNSVADELGTKLVAGRASEGDFVVVGRALARVKSINTTEYGYESYQVTFIADMPIPEIEEECVLARQVTKIFQRDRLRERVRAEMRNADSKCVPDDAELDEHLVESVREAWNMGLREAIFRP